MRYGAEIPVHTSADRLRVACGRRVEGVSLGAIVSEIIAWIAAGYSPYVVLAALSRLRWLPGSPLVLGILSAITLLIGSPSIASHLGDASDLG
jgi:hypothetical protein